VSAGEGARIQSAAQSDVGRSRTENQDAFGEFTSATGERLFVVADGMGGHRGGATASRLCVETLGREFGESALSGAARLQRGFERANERIHRAAVADPELSGMGTTAVALVLSPDGTALLCWVGDSRAYRFRDGALELLSSDHSVVGEMVRSGVLTPAEAEAHPRRNELLRAIGPRPDVEPEIRTLEHQIGDRFLLCTDGLWGPVPDAELGAVLGYEAPDLAVRKLVGKANERGGPDNVTVQIASIADPLAAVTALPAGRPIAPPPARRGRSLYVLAASAAAVGALLVALALYGFREPAADVTPSETTAAPAPRPELVAAAKAEEAKLVAARAAETRAAEARAAEARATEAKAAAAKVAEAKAAARAEARAAAKAKAAAAAKAAPPPAPKPAVAEPAPEAVPPAPAEAATPPSDATPAAESSDPPRAEVERFLSDWSAAISSKNFAAYQSLGGTDSEQDFGTRYPDNPAKFAYSLRDIEANGPEGLVVRVQMVVERTGAERVDEEHRLVLRQTPAGLRYVRSD
jgi:protein phosphatase